MGFTRFCFVPDLPIETSQKLLKPLGIKPVFSYPEAMVLAVELQRWLDEENSKKISVLTFFVFSGYQKVAQAFSLHTLI
jgi:hypothetical protein